MKAQIHIVDAANRLPESWDAMRENVFQSRAFLTHCENENACGQRYYVLTREEQFKAGGITYSLPIDLLTYLGIKSPVMMRVIGIPCSVASAGVFGDREDVDVLMREIFRQEKGLVLALNLDHSMNGIPLAAGRTWPDVVLRNRFGTWEAYEHSLRSEYRRRLVQIKAEESCYTIDTTSCDQFNEDMHALYLNVLERSEGKLERLSPSFFQHLPDAFRLTTLHRSNVLRGWIITVADEDRFWFFLGGQRYEEDARELYLVKLLQVLRQGIAAGARFIDLGQSAEIPKMRLGGVCEEKVMLASHHHAVLRMFLRWSAGLLSYRKTFPPQHVFRPEGV